MEENWSNDEYVAYYNKNYTTETEEFRKCLKLLNVGRSDSLIDFGCGNGDFLAEAAPIASFVCGIDLSPLQIRLAEEKLSGQSNAELVCTTFTGFTPGERRFTRGFSRKALHHLTDPEKAVFIKNIAPAFVSGSLLYIEDGIFFEFEREDLQANWDTLLRQAAEYYGKSWEAKKHDLMNSFLNEHPCGIGCWEKCLNDCDFKIIEKMPKSSFYGGIMARKD